PFRGRWQRLVMPEKLHPPVDRSLPEAPRVAAGVDLLVTHREHAAQVRRIGTGHRLPAVAVEARDEAPVAYSEEQVFGDTVEPHDWLLRRGHRGPCSAVPTEHEGAIAVLTPGVDMLVVESPDPGEYCGNTVHRPFLAGRCRPVLNEPRSVRDVNLPGFGVPCADVPARLHEVRLKSRLRHVPGRDVE